MIPESQLEDTDGRSDRFLKRYDHAMSRRQRIDSFQENLDIEP